MPFFCRWKLEFNLPVKKLKHFLSIKNTLANVGQKTRIITVIECSMCRDPVDMPLREKYGRVTTVQI